MRKCKRGHSDRDSSGNCRTCQADARSRYDARKKAKVKWEPHNDPKKVAEGFGVKRVSTARKVICPETGERILQWQIVEPERRKRLEVLHELFSCLPEIKPLPKRKRRPAPKPNDLLNVMVFGDPHFGMLADPDETRGPRYDLQTAHDVHVGATEDLIAKAPAAGRCLLVSMGDTGHVDNGENRTRKSKHPLDVCAKFPKIARQIVDSFAAMIDMAAAAYPLVDVQFTRGNHDPDLSIWIGLCMQQRYSNRPEVTIHVEESKFWYWTHGRCLLGFTHGDNVPGQGPLLPEIMAEDQREAWGQAEWAQWYIGHLHHHKLEERGGCMLEYMPTLAPGDEHSAGRYRSKRRARIDTYSWHGLECSHWVRARPT